MSKIWIIIQREFMTRVKKKSFILLTILMPFIFAALIMVPLMLATIEGDEQKTVMVVDKTGRYVGSLKSTANYAFVPTADNKDEFYTEDSEVEAVVQITADLAKNPTAVTIYSPREVKAELLSYVETCLGEQVRREKLSAYNIPELETIIADIQTDFHVATVKRNAEGDETSSNTYIAMTAGFIFTFLIYMFVMSYGGMVMQSVMEEKTNRIVELMVSSVKPFQLMMGKIIGVALVGFVQLAIWGVMLSIILMVCGSVFGLSAAPAVPAVAGADAQMAAMAQQAGGGEAAEIMSALMGLPYAELGIMFVLYFVGGYLLYASFFAAVGASINAQEDSSQFIMPVVLIMVFGLYAAMYSAENTNGPLAFWASIFPLTSPIVMMVRIPFGVPWWEEVLSLGLLFATSMAFVWISARIYRVGILMYGKKPSLREMLKWVRWR
ncbi:MAG: ABC transporter permease [Bacteroidales bacterium]|nr:ABC transporter permease [Bacteroidales bacterium]